MHVALGFKAHSGWAALVVVGERSRDVAVVERRRVELIENRWAGAPYHAAQDLPLVRAERLVGAALDEANRIAIRQMKVLSEELRDAGRAPVACAILMPAPMPAWTVEQILAVHIRMHKAEGVLFPDALAHAAAACGIAPVAIAERTLAVRAAQALRMPQATLAAYVARLGKPLGAPWGADQKSAALAALVALRETAPREVIES